jgi:hypothetical protein
LSVTTAKEVERSAKEPAGESVASIAVTK